MLGGYEPVTLEEVKSYKPTTNSISLGQVLHCPYNYEDTKLIVKEMTENISLDLVDKNLVTNQIVLTVGYDIENLNNQDIKYTGEITTDRYGRKIPKHAHGTINLDHHTSSTKIIMDSTMKLYERIIDKNLLVRRINISANNVIDESKAKLQKASEQLDLFGEFQKREKDLKEEQIERNLQRSILDIKKKYGKNAIVKGMNLQEAGTAIARNSQIGGHKE